MGIPSEFAPQGLPRMDKPWQFTAVPTPPIGISGASLVAT